MRTVTVNASVTYDVVIGPGLLDRAGQLAAERMKPCRAMIISDSTVDRLYGDRCAKSFESAGFPTERFVFPAGEAHKKIATLSEILECMAEKRITRSDIVVALGGRVAEELVLGDISTGASSDIQHATRVATEMVTRYGMSDRLGTVLYGSEYSRDEVFLGRDFHTTKAYSEQTAAAIDEEIRRIIDDAHTRCTAYLEAHRDKLDLVAAYLLKHETMDGDTFLAAMEREDANMEMLEEIDRIRLEKSEEENRAAAEREKARQAEEAARLARETEAALQRIGIIPPVGSETAQTAEEPTPAPSPEVSEQAPAADEVQASEEPPSDPEE